MYVGPSLKKMLVVLIFVKNELLCKTLAMLFHVDMIYLAKQAKRGVEKSFVCR